MRVDHLDLIQAALLAGLLGSNEFPGQLQESLQELDAGVAESMRPFLKASSCSERLTHTGWG